MSTKKVTVDMLRARDACTDQVVLFEKHFPNGVVPTLELCLKHAKEFDWDWATCLLSPAAREEFNKAVATAWFNAWRLDNE